MERYISILEGINDKNLFKAVILIGGAGSGKSYISSLIFGYEENDYISPFGIKVVNSDMIFEKKLKDLNLPFIMDASNEDIYAKQQEVRNMAKALTTNRVHFYLDGMLPLIIDGTGRNYNKVVDQANSLKNLGYDIDIIFVNTSLEVALERNEKRKRSVDPKIVKNMHEVIQKNIGKFQRYFGNEHFYIIDNSQYFSPNTPGAKEFENRLFKMGMKIIQSPLKNPIGIRAIQTLKKSGGKLLSDLEDIIAHKLVV